MQTLIVAALFALAGSAALAFPVSAPAGTKLGTACTSPLKALAPNLRTCLIAGPKPSRIWCPNGKAFDMDSATASVPLARSLCELTQTAD